MHKHVNLTNVKQIFSTYNYNDYDKFEFMPSLFNGNIPIPVTIVNNIIYFCAKLKYADKTVRFMCFDMNGITQKQITKKLGNIEKFTNDIFNNYSILSCSRVEPLDMYTKAYINAYYACVKYYECLYNKLNRVGIYNVDHDLIFFVNIEMDNSFWFEPYIFFGNASSNLYPLTSVDICAHELTHGLIDATLKLTYSGESGALNEAIADIFGVYTEYYISSEFDQPDWTIGEEVYKNEIGYIRSFSNPIENKQPDMYGGKFWINPKNVILDNGGVHINSSVVNYFCYLCVNGKTNYISSGGARYSVKKLSDDRFTLLDFVKIIYDVLLSSDNNNLSMRSFGDEFINSANKLVYNNDVIVHVKHCLNCTRLVPSNDGGGAPCCATPSV